MLSTKNQLTLKDIRKAIKLIERNEKHKFIRVCADCFSLERVWVKDHSKCSGNWYELDIFTGRIVRLGLGKKVIKEIKLLDTFVQKPIKKGKIGMFEGIPIVVSNASS